MKQNIEVFNSTLIKNWLHENRWEPVEKITIVNCQTTESNEKAVETVAIQTDTTNNEPYL